jgi:hypothetical protein
VNDQDDANGQPNQGDGRAATSVAKPFNASPAENTTENELDAIEKELSGFEKATLRWAKVAVLLSGLAALFVCAQWLEMHTSSRDTHDLAIAAGKQADAAKAQSDQAIQQTDKMEKSLVKTDNLIRATSDLATQAKRSADTAREALNASLAASRLDERPWVGSKGIGINFPLAADKRILGEIIIVNSGKSFALKTTAKIWIHISNTPVSELSHPDAKDISPVILFPNQEMPIKVALPAQPKEADIEALKSKKMFLYLYARVVYFDVFGKRHHTEVCGIFNGDADFEACTFHNSAD